MAWYPEPKPVPDALDTADLHLEMLEPKHVEIDYAAFMSSIARLNLWSGGRWPHAGFTLDENMADMVMHRDEFLAREAFAYTVQNAAGDRCEGCIYINPLDPAHYSNGSEALAAFPESSAAVTFWVRDDAVPRGLDRQFIDSLIGWFRNEWEFDSVTFMTRSEVDHDIALLESAGLSRVATLQGERLSGAYYLYGPV